MATQEFQLLVSYAQVAVFEKGVERPFSLWTEAHVGQGFAWRPDSASFSTLAEAGKHDVEVRVGAYSSALDEGAVRALEVPIDVWSGEVVIASIADERPVRVPAGRYALRFEAWGNESNGIPRLLFTFLEHPDARFGILRADAGLKPPETLVTGAEPA